MGQEVYLTRAGYEKMLNELDNLKTVERKKITKAIAEARAQGDLSENAEYDAAREAQGHCEARIAELEGILSSVRIIEDQSIPADKIYIGAIVTATNLTDKKDEKFQLVSPQEADFEANKLSIFSPIGKGLLGKAEGEEVHLEVPAGKLHYKILKIERP